MENGMPNVHARPLTYETDTDINTMYVLMETMEDGTKVLRPEYGMFDRFYKDLNEFPFDVYLMDPETRRFVYEDDNGFKHPRSIKLNWSRLSWVKILNTGWRMRERHRMHSGYSALPWDLDPIQDHYAHLSTVDGAKVAFTENDEKGKRDIQARMSPGKYLTRYYPDLVAPDRIHDSLRSSQTSSKYRDAESAGDTATCNALARADYIRELATQVDKACEMHIVSSTHDIVRVYSKGPSSCMSKPVREYESSCHPVSVYGESDLKLAYLAAKPLDDADFRASARALIWPEKMQYSRIYGDENRLRPVLESAGYSPGDFQGAKIRCIPEGAGFVMPYLDGCQSITEISDGFFRICDDGVYDGTETCGIIHGRGCNYCEYHEEYRNEELHYIYDRDQYWCESAVNDYAQRCEGYNRYYSDGTPFHTVNRRDYSEDYCEAYFNYCEYNKEWTTDQIEVVTDKLGGNQSVARKTLEEFCGTEFFRDEDGDWFTYDPAQVELDL